MPLLLLLGVIFLVWVPFRKSVLGRGCYAVGSNEQAAYMSGVRIDRSKLAAYTLGGFFAGCAGLYLSFQTASGSADAAQAGGYTLNSIAAVVIGGTSLFGGSGGVIGSIFGAGVLRSISFFFRVIDEDSWIGFLYDPLLQPLFEGVVLLLAVGLGAARVFRVRNRLSLFT
jgi:ribose transport system permease protein